MLSEGELNSKYMDCESHYQHVSSFLVHQPAQVRKCTDIVCTIFVILILVVFVGIGSFAIFETKRVQFKVEKMLKADQDIITPQNISRWGIGVGSSVILSFIFIALVKFLPKFMIFFMIGFSSLLFIALIIIGILNENIAVSLIAGFCLAIHTGLVIYLKKKIQIGAVIIKYTTQFLNERPLIFIMPIIKIIIASAIAFFYFYSLTSLKYIICHIQNQYILPVEVYALLYSVQTFIGVVFIFIFYYAMNYVLGFMCANWYYGIKDGRASLATGYKFMFKQIGSILLGSFMVTISIYARIIIYSFFVHQLCDGCENCCRSCNPSCRCNCLEEFQIRNCGWACVMCCCVYFTRLLCREACVLFVGCIAEIFQAILKVIGNYSVIMMSITGQSYFQSARTAIGLAHNYFDFLQITNLMSFLMAVWGILFAVVLPSTISYFIFDYSNSGNSQFDIIVGSSFLISLMIIEVITQSICCLFVVYCMDKDFVKRQKIDRERLAGKNHQAINRYSIKSSKTQDSLVTSNDYEKLP